MNALMIVVAVLVYLGIAGASLGMLSDDDNPVFNEPWAKKHGFTSDEFFMAAAALSLFWPIGGVVLLFSTGTALFRGITLLPRVWREKRHDRQKALAEKLASTIDGGKS